MSAPLRSHLAAGVLGGLVVAGAFLALGLAGRRTTHAVIEQATMTGNSRDADEALTPHAIYVRDAPGVVFVKALVVQHVTGPFELGQLRNASDSTGSGFLISRRGYILTTYHVIGGADPETGVTVDFENNVARHADVVYEDKNHDLAVLKVDMSGIAGIRPLTLGDSTTVKVGDPTLAIGNPFGYDRTLTGGIVSALQHQIEAADGFAINNVIQTDAPIAPGNSGGPLLDADGRVIGINSQIATAGDGGQGSVGIAFAVPIDTAKAFIPGVEAEPTPVPARAEKCRGGALSLRCGRGPKDQVLRDYRSR
jgi:S1-C subfamily serine protease